MRLLTPDMTFFSKSIYKAKPPFCGYRDTLQALLKLPKCPHMDALHRNHLKPACHSHMLRHASPDAAATTDGVERIDKPLQAGSIGLLLCLPGARDKLHLHVSHQHCLWGDMKQQEEGEKEKVWLGKSFCVQLVVRGRVADVQGSRKAVKLSLKEDAIRLEPKFVSDSQCTI